jgi:hypothetical protein
VSRNYFKPNKADRENARALKRLAKAERLAERKVAKLQGIEIDRLPEDQQGLARTLANGEGVEP